MCDFRLVFTTLPLCHMWILQIYLAPPCWVRTAGVEIYFFIFHFIFASSKLCTGLVLIALYVDPTQLEFWLTPAESLKI